MQPSLSQDGARSPQEQLEEEIRDAKQEIEDLKKQVEALTLKQFGISRISHAPELVRHFTGFQSKDLLDNFYLWLEPYAGNMVTWSQMKRKEAKVNYRNTTSSISSKSLYDQYFLFMVRIRLGCTETDLAVRFNLSTSTVSRIILTWINFVYIMLGGLPIWPTKAQVQKHMPVSFKQHFPHTRVILDCTEIKVQRPSSKVLNSEFY